MDVEEQLVHEQLGTRHVIGVVDGHRDEPILDGEVGWYPRCHRLGGRRFPLEPLIKAPEVLRQDPSHDSRWQPPRQQAEEAVISPS